MRKIMKLKNYIMDVEEWVNDVMLDGQFDFDNVAENATKFFKNSMAGDIASDYISQQMDIT